MLTPERRAELEKQLIRAAELEEGSADFYGSKVLADLLREVATVIRGPDVVVAAVGGQCATCGFKYWEYNGHIIPCPRCEAEKQQKENGILRGLVAKVVGKCVYCGLEEMAKCERGFPGCAWADDLMCGEDEGFKDTVGRMRKAEASLVEQEGLHKFALLVLEESRDELGDLDGGWLQDKAEELGLLVRVEATERCGENCWCAEYDEFPQECLRYPDKIKAMVDALPKEQQDG